MWYLYLALFSWHIVLKGHPHCSMYQYLIHFYDWIIFHWMYISHFSYPFICLWAFELFPSFGYCAQCLYLRACKCMHMWLFVFNYFGHIPRSICYKGQWGLIYLGMELLDHMVILRLIIWGRKKLFPFFWCSTILCRSKFLSNIFHLKDFL